MAAIFRNEGPYILEWIAFHRALGIDRCLIADNASDDGSAALLAALDRAEVIDHIPWPGRPGQPPQLPAYGEILRRHGEETDWIAFIDADEFLLPAPGCELRALLAGLGRRPEVGAVAVNWALYGSAGRAAPGEGLVTERFPARAARDAPVHRHVKTILRPAAFAGFLDTPHLFRLRDGAGVVHADGTPFLPVAGRAAGLSRAVVWEPLRLNHYAVKSAHEFFGRKRPRGRATRAELRPPRFFAEHDRNETADPVPAALLAAARAELRAIRARLRATGWSGPEPGLGVPEAALRPARRPGPGAGRARPGTGAGSRPGPASGSGPGSGPGSRDGSELEQRDRVAAQQVGADDEQAAGQPEYVER